MTSLTSIVVSMYNRNAGIVNVVDRLLFPSLLNNASEDVQLVLVDDVSPAKEETQKVLEKFLPEAESRFGDVIFVQHGENMNFSRSYNAAASRADGDSLIITNADVYFPHGSVSRLSHVALEKDAQIGAVTNGGYGYQTTDYFEPEFGGKYIFNFNGQSTKHIEIANLALSLRMGGRLYPVNSVSGFCFGMPKAVFNEVGGFDERFKTFWSDTDLSRKVKQYSDVFVDSSVFVYHHDEDSSSNQPFRGNMKPLIQFASDGLKYIWKWHDLFHTSTDFAYRAMQNMLYIGTITGEIRENLSLSES